MLGRAAFGGALLVGARLLTRLADLITMLILARALNPHSFGIVALAMSVVTVFEAVLELPVHAVLVRQPRLTRRLLDTAFTLSAARGATIALVALAICVPFANFYHNPALVPLVCALAFAPIFRSLISPRLAVFERDLSYWRQVLIDSSAKAIAATTAIVIALTSHSYWAIAAGTICYPGATALVSYVLAPYRPRFGVTRIREFIDFLGWNSAAQFVSAMNWQVERLLLGRLQSPVRLGLFTASNDLAGIPYFAIFTPLSRPIYAVLSHARDDSRALRATYERVSAAALAIGLPLLIGESCVAEEMTLFVLGDKWSGAATLVRWLSLSLLPALFALPATPLFLALGDSRRVLRRNLVEMSCKLPAVIFGTIQFGVAGIVGARLFSEIVAAAYGLFVVHAITGISFRDQLFFGWRSVVSSASMAAVLVAARAPLLGLLGAHSAAAKLAVLVPVGALVYLAMHVLLWVMARRPYGIESLALSALRRLIIRYARPQRIAPAA